MAKQLSFDEASNILEMWGLEEQMEEENLKEIKLMEQSEWQVLTMEAKSGVKITFEWPIDQMAVV